MLIPDFDGDPVQVIEPGEGGSVVPGEESNGEEQESGSDTSSGETGVGPEIDIDTGETPVRKYYVKDIPVTIAQERVQYYGKDGKLITESLKDYTRDNVLQNFPSQIHFYPKMEIG